MRSTTHPGKVPEEGHTAKLRHIALSVADPHKSAEFYRKAFGMKKVGETDWTGARGVYLSD
ncbi:MAG: glyoxalase, partial [Betaproteobacteria bacterium]|nr:glyoxalase [Betaproteobacteria bacterium]